MRAVTPAWLHVCNVAFVFILSHALRAQTCSCVQGQMRCVLCAHARVHVRECAYVRAHASAQARVCIDNCIA